MEKLFTKQDAETLTEKLKDNDEVNELTQELDALKAEQTRLENCENEEEYDAMLDEVGLNPDTYPASMILKAVDPIAYNCGHSDYNDARIGELNDEIEDKEQEIKDAQAN